MKRLKLYLDTSIINFLFVEDAPDFKKVTEDFFEKYFESYDVYISDIVLLEINKTEQTTIKEKLLAVIDKYPFKIIKIEHAEIINKLAQLYLREGVVPAKKRDDAFHLALSTVYEMDILLSWNFKHLANIRKQIAVNALNEQEGFLKKLNLLSPLEVEYEEEP